MKLVRFFFLLMEKHPTRLFCGILIRHMSGEYLWTNELMYIRKGLAVSETILKEISKLEAVHKATGSKGVHKNYRYWHLRRLIKATSAAKEVKSAWQYSFEYRNKPKRELARIVLAEADEKSGLADVMNSVDGSYVSLLKDKVKVLSDYYTDLYKSQDLTEGQWKQFFDNNIEVPLLSQKHR